MTTLDYLSSEASAAKRPSALASLKAMWLRFKQRRKTARAIRDLSQLDARLLRDIGIEPLDVYDALNGRNRSILFDPMRRTGHE
jgi:uncharacterized protein YjiS (DUF1127 family)